MPLRPANLIPTLPPVLLTETTALPATLHPLFFQQLPTIKFCNPFVLITMQIARGVGAVPVAVTSRGTLTPESRP